MNSPIRMSKRVPKVKRNKGEMEQVYGNPYRKKPDLGPHSKKPHPPLEVSMGSGGEHHTDIGKRSD